MPQQRDPWMWEVRDAVRDSVDLVLRTQPWTGRDQVLYCHRICVCNHTSTGGDVTVGIFQGGHYFELCTVYGLIAGMWAHAHVPFTFLNKWQLFARFHYEVDGNGDPCGNGDDCEMHVIGYVLEPYSSP